MCSWMEANFLHEIINFHSPRDYWIGINSAATHPRIWKGIRMQWFIQSRRETIRKHLFTINNKATNLDKRKFVHRRHRRRWSSHLDDNKKIHLIRSRSFLQFILLRSDNRLHILSSVSKPSCSFWLSQLDISRALHSRITRSIIFKRTKMVINSREEMICQCHRRSILPLSTDYAQHSFCWWIVSLRFEIFFSWPLVSCFLPFRCLLIFQWNMLTLFPFFWNERKWSRMFISRNCVVCIPWRLTASMIERVMSPIVFPY